MNRTRTLKKVYIIVGIDNDELLRNVRLDDMLVTTLEKDKVKCLTSKIIGIPYESREEALRELQDIPSQIDKKMRYDVIFDYYEIREAYILVNE